VVISARVSKTGVANPQPGDLQGASKPVANDASGVRVVIDSVVR
jgi:cytochrome c-type biogenesis protein CcmH